MPAMFVQIIDYLSINPTDANHLAKVRPTALSRPAHTADHLPGQRHPLGILRYRLKRGQLNELQHVCACLPCAREVAGRGSCPDKFLTSNDL
jgi:hypothetical protein